MGNLFAELKRRHIYRVAAGYTVVAWLIIQFVNNIAPMLKLPDWIAAAILVVLMAGLPVALVFAWVVDLKAPNASSATRTGAVDWVFAAVATAIVALLTYQQFATLGAGTVQKEAGLEAARIAAAKPAGISVAVLPFANLSGDPAQEFFSDGMTEEITTALAKVSSLTVIGRTSAFQFKGRAEDLRAIGQALSAKYLIEGSVRKAGERVRVTAQLIRVESGAHLWAENYDRQLTDIFAIQEDIAQAIASALKVPLGLQGSDRLVSNRDIDPESYQQYLRARGLVRARGSVRNALVDASALLEKSVARNPNYAPAWALLAQAYALTPNYDPAWQSGSFEELRRLVDASLPRAETAARRAVELDANNADGYTSLGLTQTLHGKLLQAADLYSKALALDSNNPDALHRYADLLVDTGHLKEALTVREQLQALDPFVPVFTRNAASALWLNGQTDRAIALAQMLPLEDGFRGYLLSQIYSVQGRYTDAADVLATVSPGLYQPGIVEAAVSLLRTAPTSVPRQTLPRLGYLSFVYLYVGAPDRVLDFFEGAVAAGYTLGNFIGGLWHPAYASLRKTDRFKALLRASGRIEYWRVKGWPEFCHPTTGDDFECN